MRGSYANDRPASSSFKDGGYKGDGAFDQGLALRGPAGASTGQAASNLHGGSSHLADQYLNHAGSSVDSMTNLERYK